MKDSTRVQKKYIFRIYNNTNNRANFSITLYASNTSLAIKKFKEDYGVTNLDNVTIEYNINNT